MKIISEQIEKADTEEQVMSLLEDRSRDDSLEIAKHLSVYTFRKNMDQIKEAILNFTVRAKHRTKIITGKS